VIGAGSWGTALGKVLADKGSAVTLWGRASDHIDEIQEKRVNARYLPGVTLPPTLRATSDLEAAVRDKRFVISVVPSHTVRDVMGRAGKAMSPDAIVVSASKGIENETLATMDEVLKDILPGKLGAQLAFLSGPSFAKEVGAGLPTAVVMASRDRRIATEAAALFQSDRFRVYTSDDVAGVELGGALKNVMAIAAGVADGLGLGYNSRAALITRGLAEITRLAVRKGANPLTLAGLAGLGDLVLTCTGDLSRNRTVGMGLGRGQTLREVLAGMSQVAEGVKTTKSAHDLAERLGVEMPITDAMYHILYEDQPAREAVSALMGRAPKHELA
jgi:glycerol-3-phosphate dehydrogenase (NAD(P)+)